MNTEHSTPAVPRLAGPAPGSPLRDAKGRPYEPAVSPRLKILLFFTFGCVSVLGATGAYLVAIRLMEWAKNNTYTNQFTLWMFLVHVTIGVILVAPFLVFGFSHYATARYRKNRLAVKLGLTLFVTGIIVGLSGLLLIQLEGLPQIPTGTLARSVIYFLHVLAPVAAVTLYILHRRAGPDIAARAVHTGSRLDHPTGPRPRNAHHEGRADDIRQDPRHRNMARRAHALLDQRADVAGRGQDDLRPGP